MNSLKNILLVGLVALATALPAGAALENDVFGTTRAALIGTPGQLVHNILLTTNGPIDLLGYTGRGEVILTTATNMTVLGTLTATIETSADTTNWTGLGSFALINSTTAISVTNMVYGSTNLIITNSFLLPFTTTLPTPASAGYATPYPAPNLYTNVAGAITCANMALPVIVGVNLTDSARYMHIIWTAGGGATNGNTFVSGLLIGNRYFVP
jgi:hypothetical protein